jgi:hypothetical protein
MPETDFVRDHAVDVSLGGVPRDIYANLTQMGLHYLVVRRGSTMDFLKLTVWGRSLTETLFKLSIGDYWRLIALDPCLPGAWRADCAECGVHEWHAPDDFVCVFCRERRSA